MAPTPLTYDPTKAPYKHVFGTAIPSDGQPKPLIPVDPHFSLIKTIADMDLPKPWQPLLRLPERHRHGPEYKVWKKANEIEYHRESIERYLFAMHTTSLTRPHPKPEFLAAEKQLAHHVDMYKLVVNQWVPSASSTDTDTDLDLRPPTKPAATSTGVPPENARKPPVLAKHAKQPVSDVRKTVSALILPAGELSNSGFDFGSDLDELGPHTASHDMLNKNFDTNKDAMSRAAGKPVKEKERKKKALKKADKDDTGAASGYGGDVAVGEVEEQAVSKSRLQLGYHGAKNANGNKWRGCYFVPSSCIIGKKMQGRMTALMAFCVTEGLVATPVLYLTDSQTTIFEKVKQAFADLQSHVDIPDGVMIGKLIQYSHRWSQCAPLIDQDGPNLKWHYLESCQAMVLTPHAMINVANDSKCDHHSESSLQWWEKFEDFERREGGDFSDSDGDADVEDDGEGGVSTPSGRKGRKRAGSTKINGKSAKDKGKGKVVEKEKGKLKAPKVGGGVSVDDAVVVPESPTAAPEAKATKVTAWVCPLNGCRMKARTQLALEEHMDIHGHWDLDKLSDVSTDSDWDSDNPADASSAEYLAHCAKQAAKKRVKAERLLRKEAREEIQAMAKRMNFTKAQVDKMLQIAGITATPTHSNPRKGRPASAASNRDEAAYGSPAAQRPRPPARVKKPVSTTAGGLVVPAQGDMASDQGPQDAAEGGEEQEPPVAPEHMDVDVKPFIHGHSPSIDEDGSGNETDVSFEITGMKFGKMYRGRALPPPLLTCKREPEDLPPTGETSVDPAGSTGCHGEGSEGVDAAELSRRRVEEDARAVRELVEALAESAGRPNKSERCNTPWERPMRNKRKAEGPSYAASASSQNPFKAAKTGTNDDRPRLRTLRPAKGNDQARVSTSALAPNAQAGPSNHPGALRDEEDQSESVAGVTGKRKRVAPPGLDDFVV